MTPTWEEMERRSAEEGACDACRVREQRLPAGLGGPPEHWPEEEEPGDGDVAAGHSGEAR